jgi:uncharacterized protein (DUF779 family)
MYIERLAVTEKAGKIIDQLKEKHGELIFHQSGGCCDGSAPMCFEKGDFMIGSRDVFLGEIRGCRFYMASDQFEYFKYMHITIDVTEGRGASFSLEIPLGVRFMTVLRILTDEEAKNIRPVEMGE